MLDVEKAFDRVWHQGLIYKMIQLNFPPHIINMVSKFLTNRTFCVHIGNGKSQQYNIEFGLPQGAVLIPTLYNIYTHDIPKNPNTKLALFADDTAFYATSSCVKDVLKPIKQHAQQIQNYMEK